MNLNKNIKVFIILMLGLLIVSAFFVRKENYLKTETYAVDEFMYFMLGGNLKHNFPQYTPSVIIKHLIKERKPVPKQYELPLYKHPPVYSLLIAGSLMIFDDNLVSAVYVSLAMSMLLILIVYLLGSLIFDWKVGLMAALLLWMDPANIICSQKVWLDTTIALFSTLSLYFFAAGLKKKNDNFFILSGIASGLAANTKYTGALITFAIAGFALIYHREFYKRPKFIVSLFLPFFMLIPWIIWNINVYGMGFIDRQYSSHTHLKDLLSMLSRFSGFLLPLFAALGLLVYFYLRLKKRHAKEEKNEVIDDGHDLPSGSKGLQIFSFLLIGVLLFVVLKEQVLNSLTLNSLPSTSWWMYYFAREPSTFYFGRLIEYSFIYVFGLIALFAYHPDEQRGAAVLRISAVVILIFFIAWGNYQTRYILSAIPMLLILASDVIIRIYNWISLQNNFLLRLGLKSVFILMLCFVTMRTMFINFMISFPNDLCYF